MEMPACSLPKPRSSMGEAAGSALGQTTGESARGATQMCTHTLGQTQPPPTPWYQAPASWAPESICSALWDAIAPKPSFSSPSPSRSPATGLQIAHGDIPNIHLEAKSNKGGIKRTCTIQEASTAAHREQYINTDCSSEDLEIKKSPN